MRDLNVLSVDGVSRVVGIETTSDVKDVYGIEKLMQEVIKASLGSNSNERINTFSCGNLRKLLGPESISRDINELKPKITTYIMDVEKFIISNQALENIPDEESLRSITIVDVYLDETYNRVMVDLLVKNKLSQIITGSVGV